MKKYAFTLAEVLITIGIVGLVAALTIPNLITNYQKKQTVNRLKNTYSALATAVRLSEADNGELSGWDFSLSADNFVEQYLLPYMKYSKKEMPKLKYKRLSGISESSIIVMMGPSTTLSILNGVDLAYYKYNSLSRLNALILLVDINGYNNLPNQFGKDTFWIFINKKFGVEFAFRDDGTYEQIKNPTREVLMNGPSAQSYQCNKAARGAWCGQLIKQDGWKISKDYPW